MAAASIELGSVLGGKFKVIRRIGAGGMGSVYEVEHTLTKHRRALKLLHRRIAAGARRIVTRFLREASAAGHIGNPHIVETFDAGQLPEAAQPYIVMELLQGHRSPTTSRQRGSAQRSQRPAISCSRPVRACRGARGRDRAPRPQAREPVS